MTADCIRTLQTELYRQQRIQNRMKKRLQELKPYDDRRLLANRQHGRIGYYLIVKEGDSARRKYISKKEDIFRKQLQELYYLKHAIPLCQKNIEMLEMLVDSYCSLDPEEVVKDAPLAYKEQENAMRLVYGYDNETTWKRKKLAWKSKFTVPYPEGLKHVAGDGTPTRSISEAVIIDLLNIKGIPYAYDFPMYLGNKLKWPDFIIWDKKHNRELLIEHLGLMGDEDYREDQNEKIKLYIEEGYVPNVDLLLTYNDKNGNINVPAISRMIDAIMCS